MYTKNTPTFEPQFCMNYSGLTSSKAEQLLKTIGPNELPNTNISFWQRMQKKIFAPISLMLFIASLLSLVSNKFFDFYFILILLFLNTAISLWQERKADNAIEQLNKKLETKIKTQRDEKWIDIDSTKLVPKDVIKLEVGDIIPADSTILEAHNLTVNDSVVTGESLPKEKKVADTVYSGAFLATGIAILQIEKTGGNTYFGKTFSKVERIRKKSLLEKDIINISKFLTLFSLIGVAILSLAFFIEHAPIPDLLTIDLSLIIAGIPISLPTVMTLIIELGVISLAAKNVIVRRISALEDFANVNLLLTDKTGTLTKNKITVHAVIGYGNTNPKDALFFAASLCNIHTKDVINEAIVEKWKEEAGDEKTAEIINFSPADSMKKRSEAELEIDGKNVWFSLGAAQIIERISKENKKIKSQFERDVWDFAQKGYRCLALSTKRGGGTKAELIGLIALSDEIRNDAKETIAFLKENGIGVVMLTGDNRAIAKEVVRKLQIDEGNVLTREELLKRGFDTIDKQLFQKIGAFAEILPDDKFKLVEKAGNYYVVAVTGDGVNDLPAVKQASVGIAVKNAVDALKSAADIVLLSNGISVIREAIIESRKIFVRLYSYSLYRMSESFRLIVTIVILGLVYRVYPLTPLQIILIALLNDIPIISLAFDRVKHVTRPATMNVNERFLLSTLFGSVGVVNSLLLFFFLTQFIHMDWEKIQTLYFLKLTVSGHLLIYVARTRQRWFRFLPSKQVFWATSLTQLISTLLAFTGFLMPSPVSIGWIVFVWAWAFFWMQISELMKDFQQQTAKLIHAHYPTFLLPAKK